MTMDIRAATALFLSACLLTATQADDIRHAAALPDECTEKVDLMPDLCQTDEAFRSLPYGGRYSCGPTAFANVLVAMDRRGYEDLVPEDGQSKEQQRALLEQLGTKPYLHTTRHGTGPISAMAGIRRFVQDRGYDALVEWRGWRHGGEFSSGEFVDPNWLLEGVLGESNVVVNVGWYKHDEPQRLYTRIGGHYMTLVGYQKEGDEITYLIHDPAPRAGTDKTTHHVRLVPIQAGELAPWKKYGKRSAVGYFLLEGIVLKSTADVAILDGAIRLTISKRE